MIFISYELGSYDHESKKLHISRDALFQETHNWTWTPPQGHVTSGMSELLNSFKLMGLDYAETHEQGPSFEQGESSTQSESQSRPSGPIFLSSSLCPEDETPQKRRGICDIYAETQPMDEIHQVCLSTIEEPINFQEVVSHVEWRQAVQEEYDSILRNQTWDLVPMPPRKKAIGLCWIFKVKKNSKGEIARYMARLVAIGYVQKLKLIIAKCLFQWLGWTP